MNTPESTNESKPSTKQQSQPSLPQQSIPLTPELQQQISVLNGRISNANFAYSDLLREMDSAIKTTVTTILTLRKENAALKAKLNEASKSP
jgi:hypothetical protein